MTGGAGNCGRGGALAAMLRLAWSGTGSPEAFSDRPSDTDCSRNSRFRTIPRGPLFDEKNFLGTPDDFFVQRAPDDRQVPEAPESSGRVFVTLLD